MYEVQLRNRLTFVWVDVIDGAIKLLGARGSIYCDQL